jgi:cytochrome c553
MLVKVAYLSDEDCARIAAHAATLRARTSPARASLLDASGSEVAA